MPLLAKSKAADSLESGKRAGIGDRRMTRLCHGDCMCSAVLRCDLSVFHSNGSRMGNVVSCCFTHRTHVRGIACTHA